MAMAIYKAFNCSETHWKAQMHNAASKREDMRYQHCAIFVFQGCVHPPKQYLSCFLTNIAPVHVVLDLLAVLEMFTGS